MSQILEHVVSQQVPSHHSTTTTSGAVATSSGAPQKAKFPFGAAPAPHLSSSASLREFDAWRHKFKGYVMLTKISSVPPIEQRAALVSVLDEKWTRILRFGIGVSDDTELEPALDAMEAYLRGQRNILVDRRDFYSRVQEPGVTFDDFLARHRRLDTRLWGRGDGHWLDMVKPLVIPESTLDPPDSADLFAVGHHPLNCLGTFPSHLELGNKRTNLVVSVIK
ncbi:hypothetical protein Hamer_G003217 [Homarus americanus]|uniref:Uncharacterized protein n=1 Tax=Homarus americanus TaxID=6706 RepID=A0A8J5TF50_HOMAM|nr:hypothetical protein Hamer_G003217 [Homarus americanus]